VKPVYTQSPGVTIIRATNLSIASGDRGRSGELVAGTAAAGRRVGFGTWPQCPKTAAKPVRRKTQLRSRVATLSHAARSSFVSGQTGATFRSAA
jgi:hypothetical protein